MKPQCPYCLSCEHTISSRELVDDPEVVSKKLDLAVTYYCLDCDDFFVSERLGGV